MQRVAIVDLDVHQGNGTHGCFAGDEQVFTFSMHGAKNFPFHKVPGTLDVELEDGTGDEAYLALLQTHLPGCCGFPGPIWWCIWLVPIRTKGTGWVVWP